jgi:hypothetical protein
LFTFSDEALSFEADEDTVDYFTLGACPNLAYEIHKLTGWTIALFSSSPAGSPEYLGHVFTIDSNGMAVDITGRRTIQNLQDQWWFANYLHRFWNLKEFEHEMLDWELSKRIGKDPRAKEWAHKIVEHLR